MYIETKFREYHMKASQNNFQNSDEKIFGILIPSPLHPMWNSQNRLQKPLLQFAGCLETKFPENQMKDFQKSFQKSDEKRFGLLIPPPKMWNFPKLLKGDLVHVVG